MQNEQINYTNLYIAKETREAIDKVGEERTYERIEEIDVELYQKLDSHLKKIAAKQISGKSFIIYTPEVGIHKARILLKLCAAYQMPYIVNRVSEKEILEVQAHMLGIEEMIFFTLEEAVQLKIGKWFRTVVKGEEVSLERLQEGITKQINVLGFQKI